MSIKTANHIMQKILRKEVTPKSGKGRISFSWDILFLCNYRCPYCWFYNHWHDLAKFNRSYLAEEWITGWKNIFEKYGSCYIEIAGGEPFIYPNFVSLIREISKMHSLVITTNLSIDIDEFIKQVDSSRVEVGITFHPLYADFDEFIKKALTLKEYGFTNKVIYLAYPPQIKLIDYFKKRFEENGLTVTVTTFWGKYNGISYPEGYTQREIEIIKNDIGERNKEKYQLKPKEVRGKLCNAGHTYAVIKPYGTVIRCGGSLMHEELGNFFDKDFRLLDKPMPCNGEVCCCNEWAFLLEEKIEGQNGASDAGIYSK